MKPRASSMGALQSENPEVQNEMASNETAPQTNRLASAPEKPLDSSSSPVITITPDDSSHNNDTQFSFENINDDLFFNSDIASGIIQNENKVVESEEQDSDKNKKVELRVHDEKSENNADDNAENVKDKKRKSSSLSLSARRVSSSLGRKMSSSLQRKSSTKDNEEQPKPPEARKFSCTIL